MNEGQAEAQLSPRRHDAVILGPSLSLARQIEAPEGGKRANSSRSIRISFLVSSFCGE
jgi:hypothetical protein